jgi:hypothetical protein
MYVIDTSATYRHMHFLSLALLLSASIDLLSHASSNSCPYLQRQGRRHKRSNSGGMLILCRGNTKELTRKLRDIIRHARFVVEVKRAGSKMKIERTASNLIK